MLVSALILRLYDCDPAKIYKKIYKFAQLNYMYVWGTRVQKVSSLKSEKIKKSTKQSTLDKKYNRTEVGHYFST